MHWLDPIDCRRARDLIAQQQHAPAASLLLSSPDRAHRAAQQLLADLLPKLVDEARSLRDQSVLPAAKERIDLAAQCGALSAEQQQLHDVISTEFSRQQQQLDHEQQRLQQAKQWAAEGRVVSALGLVHPLESTAAELARRDWQEQRQRFERYLTEAETFIEQLAFAAARDRLNRALAIQAVHPRLVEVEARYQAAVGIQGQAPQNSESAVPDPKRWRLNDTLLATGHELVFGNPRGEGVTVPLLANIHSRHAVVVRHRLGHQLLAMPGCETRRNGELLTGACELMPDDLLQFGAAAACQWRYRRPIQNSLTAVFEPTGSTNTSSIRLPDGASSRCVVWWDDVLVIAARATTAAHVVVSDLPVPELRLHREHAGFRVGATSADLSIERGSIEVPLTQEVLTYPCRLVVRVKISEADILRQQFASRGRESVSDHCVLDLRVVGP